MCKKNNFAHEKVTIEAKVSFRVFTLRLIRFCSIFIVSTFQYEFQERNVAKKFIPKTINTYYLY